MAEISPQIEIPNRPLFKAAEVCDLAKVQPYVLRSWEAEFKDLGVARSGSAARVYRREDVERVLRIKHLLLIEGLTLAGVRRRLDEEAELPLDADPILPASASPLSTDARARIIDVKRGLRSLLDLLDAPLRVPHASSRASEVSEPTLDFALAPPLPDASASAAASARAEAADAAPKSSSPRRKRSA
jgi:DNA-binding transcriptional MerR regulator